MYTRGVEYDTNKHSPPVHWRQNARKKKISPSLETESKKTKQKDMLNRTKTTARRDRVKLQLAESFLKKKLNKQKVIVNMDNRTAEKTKKSRFVLSLRASFPLWF